MTLGVLQAFLCIVAAVALGLLYPIADFQIRRHLRRAHPQLWRRFGFPSDSFAVRPEHERLHAVADIGFAEFFSTGRFRDLNDDRLLTLYRRKKALRSLGALVLLLLAVNFMAFHASPDFSWLTD